jgi:tetratricopeptide (TPR) repeat protein
MLYERYGTEEHAEEAYLAVLKMDPKFEKIHEIYFRLSQIYKHRQKYDHAIECIKFLLSKPPKVLKEHDLLFQIGHIHECQKDYKAAREVFEKIVLENPSHVKSIQQLGWMCFGMTPYHNLDMAVAYFKKVIDVDPSDSLTWYLLGRCFIAQQKFSKAYEAYQQAVYRDGKNPNIWCSIGVLYFQINQYRDALDAYSRAIHINPYLNEVWWNLGILYESCNNQISDSIDAYQRAYELDPTNQQLKQRLSVLRAAQSSGYKIPNSQQCAFITSASMHRCESKSCIRSQLFSPCASWLQDFVKLPPSSSEVDDAAVSACQRLQPGFLCEWCQWDELQWHCAIQRFLTVFQAVGASSAAACWCDAGLFPGSYFKGLTSWRFSCRCISGWHFDTKFQHLDSLDRPHERSAGIFHVQFADASVGCIISNGDHRVSELRQWDGKPAHSACQFLSDQPCIRRSLAERNSLVSVPAAWNWR